MDREKVIKALECCKRKDGNECKVCPYTESAYCTEDMSTEALVLLKEQKAYIEHLEEMNEKYGYINIVRCKDCKECYFASNRIQREQTFACGKHGIDVTQDWFCADGERREE
jgi:hypothetical protein